MSPLMPLDAQNLQNLQIIELDDGKIYRKPLGPIFDGKNHGFL
jgi:hypothetical protein